MKRIGIALLVILQGLLVLVVDSAFCFYMATLIMDNQDSIGAILLFGLCGCASGIYALRGLCNTFVGFKLLLFGAR